MALGHAADFRASGPSIATARRDRIADDLFEPDTGRSNFAAFLLGGVVIAGGMLAFLYYDTDNLGRRGDDIATGSIISLDSRPAPMAVPVAPKPAR